MVAFASFESVAITQHPDYGPIVVIQPGRHWNQELCLVGDNTSWLEGPYLKGENWYFSIIGDETSVLIGEGQYDLTSPVGARAAARALYYAFIGVSPAVVSY